MRLPSTPSAVRGVVFLLLVLVVGTVGLVVVMVRDGGAPAARTSSGEPMPTAPEVSTLAELDRAGLVVTRDAFCDRVATETVEAALEGPVSSERAYQNGDTAQVDPTTTDVAHEFGCTWTSATGAMARAWVFAPPVTPVRARSLTRTVPAATGCATRRADAFGDPGIAFGCTGAGLVSMGHAGLFADAWLTCTVAVPVGGSAQGLLTARVDRWCVGVAVAASASAGPGAA